jgi:hypothetical protein
VSANTAKSQKDNLSYQGEADTSTHKRPEGVSLVAGNHSARGGGGTNELNLRGLGRLSMQSCDNMSLLVQRIFGSFSQRRQQTPAMAAFEGSQFKKSTLSLCSRIRATSESNGKAGDEDANIKGLFGHSVAGNESIIWPTSFKQSMISLKQA